MNHPLPIGTRVRLFDDVTGEIVGYLGEPNVGYGFYDDEGWYTEVLYEEVVEILS